MAGAFGESTLKALPQACTTSQCQAKKPSVVGEQGTVMVDVWDIKAKDDGHKATTTTTRLTASSASLAKAEEESINLAVASTAAVHEADKGPNYVYSAGIVLTQLLLWHRALQHFQPSSGALPLLSPSDTTGHALFVREEAVRLALSLELPSLIGPPLRSRRFARERARATCTQLTTHVHGAMLTPCGGLWWWPTDMQEELASLLRHIGCGLFFLWSGWKAAGSFASVAPAMRLDARNRKQRRYHHHQHQSLSSSPVH
jgi:hypothetical protein